MVKDSDRKKAEEREIENLVEQKKILKEPMPATPTKRPGMRGLLSGCRYLTQQKTQSRLCRHRNNEKKSRWGGRKKGVGEKVSNLAKKPRQLLGARRYKEKSDTPVPRK